MAEQKVEPVTVTVQDVQSSNPSASAAESADVKPAPSSESGRLSVRKELLDAVVVHQAQRISELERMVEKKRAKIERLSTPQQFLHPSQLCVIPPGTPAAAVAAAAVGQKPMQPPSTAGSALPKTGTVRTTSQAPQQHASMPMHNPIPQHNPVMAAAMAAVAATGNPQVSGPLPAPFPFIYAQPDPSAMAAANLMGVVPPPHPPPQPQPVPVPQTSQPTQSSEGNDRKQSRYWTADEHQRFLAAVNICGPKNYNQISEFVGTRNAKQVRTHAQKFQKKKEREEARRRSHVRLPGMDSTRGSVGAAAAAAVAAAAAAAIHGNVPGAAASGMLVNDGLPARGGPTSSSSGKNFFRPDQPDQMRAESSGDGSSSTNDTSGEGHHMNGSDSIGDHGASSAAAAAAAAVAAEAAALGGGMLQREGLTAVRNGVGDMKTNGQSTASNVKHTTTEAKAPAQNNTSSVKMRPTEANAPMSAVKTPTSGASDHPSEPAKLDAKNSVSEKVVPNDAAGVSHGIPSGGNEGAAKASATGGDKVLNSRHASPVAETVGGKQSPLAKLRSKTAASGGKEESKPSNANNGQTDIRKPVPVSTVAPRSETKTLNPAEGSGSASGQKQVTPVPAAPSASNSKTASCNTKDLAVSSNPMNSSSETHQPGATAVQLQPGTQKGTVAEVASKVPNRKLTDDKERSNDAVPISSDAVMVTITNLKTMDTSKTEHTASVKSPKDALLRSAAPTEKRNRMVKAQSPVTRAGMKECVTAQDGSGGSQTSKAGVSVAKELAAGLVRAAGDVSGGQVAKRDMTTGISDPKSKVSVGTAMQDTHTDCELRVQHTGQVGGALRAGTEAAKPKVRKGADAALVPGEGKLKVTKRSVPTTKHGTVRALAANKPGTAGSRADGADKADVVRKIDEGQIGCLKERGKQKSGDAVLKAKQKVVDLTVDCDRGGQARKNDSAGCGEANGGDVALGSAGEGNAVKHEGAANDAAKARADGSGRTYHERRGARDEVVAEGGACQAGPNGDGGATAGGGAIGGQGKHRLDEAGTPAAKRARTEGGSNVEDGGKGRGVGEEVEGVRGGKGR